MDKDLSESINKPIEEKLSDFDVYLYTELIKAETAKMNNRNILYKFCSVPMLGMLLGTMISIIAGFNPLVFVGILGSASVLGGALSVSQIKKINYKKLGITKKEFSKLLKSGKIDELQYKLDNHYDLMRRLEFNAINNPTKNSNNLEKTSTKVKNQEFEIINDENQELSL